jgi:hypothetical protein
VTKEQLQILQHSLGADRYGRRERYNDRNHYVTDNDGKDAPEDSAKHAKWEALEHFIPHKKDGIGCEQCKMFVPKTGVEVIVDKTEALKEWEQLYGKRI